MTVPTPTLPACVPAIADPLAWLGEPGSALAQLAFGRGYGETGPGSTQTRHLALLSIDTLELDLADPSQRQFGDYELLELIGEGGMGVVYRAHQTSLDREVAIKLLAAGPWASRDFVERFKREAQNAARMQYPNIVAIYEVGNAEELHFFSMRLVRGGNLAALLKREGMLPPTRAAQLLRTIAEAVDYAHRLGVLHLDLKPANVLLDENGHPHVADFGLARRLDSALAAQDDEVSGTPSYMAPEQASPSAARITPATDIWGLGAILYELVSGRPPFLAENPQATLELVVDGVLRNPRRYVPSLPRDIEAIILKCLEREASARYASARALADDLGRFIEGRAVGARPLHAPQRIARWAAREPTLALTAAAASAALIVGLAATTQQWQRAENNAQLVAASAGLANERLWQARIDQAAIAVRDGNSYGALPGLAANIKEREAQGLDAHEDRLRVAMIERSAPRLIDLIAMNSRITGIAINPDGSSAAVATEDERLRLIDTATGKERWQTTFKNASRFFPGRFGGTPIRLEMLRFSADGQRLIGRHHAGIPTAVTPTGYDEILFDAVTGKVEIPPDGNTFTFRDATFSPDGAYAIVRSTDHRAVLMSTTDWAPLGPAQKFDKTNPAWLVTTEARHVASMVPGFVHLRIRDPRTLAVRHAFDYAASHKITAWASAADGESIVVGHLDGQIERIDCASGRSERFSPSPIGRIGWVAVSGDGRWFGAVADSGEVLVWDAATGKLAAPMMHLNTTPENHSDQLFIDAAARTVIASIDEKMGLWYLPDAISAPVRLGGEFPIASAWSLRSFAYAALQGLIATDRGHGELGLWRVQQFAPRGLRSPPMQPDQLKVGNGHIVAVEHNSVRVVDAADGSSVGPELELAQPAGFAEITPDGGSLVVLAGHQILVYDTTSFTLRQVPIDLPNDPASLVLSPDSRHVFVLFADYEKGVNRETGRIWDLVDGAAGGPAIFVEPLTHVRFAADGRSLLLWRDDHLQMIDTATLQPRWPMISLGKRLARAERVDDTAGRAPSPDSNIELTDVQFSADASQIDALSADAAAHQGTSLLWRFDVATGTELGRSVLSETGGGESFAMMPDRRKAVVLRPDSGPLWWDETRGAIELPAYSRSEFRALALTSDATIFASPPSLDRIALTSTRSLQWLSPPLPIGVPVRDQYTEYATHLAFTDDGAGLVGRTYANEWLYWDIRPDSRPVDRIAREAMLLNPDQTRLRGGLSVMLAESERQQLRAADAGPPMRIGGLRSMPIPPRPAGLAADRVDLGAAYNTSLAEITHGPSNSSYRELSPGVHRFFDVDYDVRGAIVLSVRGFASEVNPDFPPPYDVRGIRPGVPRVGALNLLVTAPITLMSQQGPYAIVEIDYRDGNRARLPIVFGRDVVQTWAQSDGIGRGAQARVAWRARNTGSPGEYAQQSRIFAVRLINPHPERAVASLALEAVDEPWSVPWIFAITTEPAPLPAS